ncbi:cell division protein FtsZ [Nitrospirillum amazonense]|uniref:Cell division protein FtsZ n=1 Tax=Nitrospirillum amazonense TaxID=28077 RepID=A0A560FHY1_9PROT|nr:cell division protein FtsZ [Nitrospirillum amazonense]TWB21219.1 cell division protein FtsZ [Nitrospirillum amazonense]
MTIKVTIPPVEVLTRPRITVFGVGGAGGNAVNNMIRSNLEGVEFVVANTDAQALTGSEATKRLQLGSTITRGLGAGSRPDVGRAAAEEQLEEILSYLEGTNMCFITAGMGGGTGTGAAPVIARAAREQGILTVGVVTKPFHFEGAHRMRIAESGINELAGYVDTLIIIPNQNLFRVANEKTTFADAFKMADDVLHSGVRGVTDLMVMPGLINLDFADIRTVMTEMGKAMMGTGEATGERRAVEAAEAAISNPLLDDVSMKGARGVLINITGGYDMTLFEVDEAANRIRDEVDPDANIIFGSTFDAQLDGKMRVSVVATGIETLAGQQPRQQPAAPQLAVVSTNAVRRAPAPAATPSVSTPVRPAGASYHAALTPAPVAPTAAAPAVPAPLAVPMAAAQPAPQMAVPAPAPFTPAVEAAPAPMAAPAAEMAPEPVAEQPAPRAEVPMRAPAPGALRGERSGAGFIPPRPADAGPRLGAPNPERYTPPQAEPRKKGIFQRMFGFGGDDPAPAPQVQHPQPAQRQPAPAAHYAPQQHAPQVQHPQPAQQHAPAPQAAPRQQPAVHQEPGLGRAPGEDSSLDIPAFLRRQAN